MENFAQAQKLVQCFIRPASGNFKRKSFVFCFCSCFNVRKKIGQSGGRVEWAQPLPDALAQCDPKLYSSLHQLWKVKINPKKIGTKGVGFIVAVLFSILAGARKQAKYVTQKRPRVCSFWSLYPQIRGRLWGCGASPKRGKKNRFLGTARMTSEQLQSCDHANGGKTLEHFWRRFGSISVCARSDFWRRVCSWKWYSSRKKQAMRLGPKLSVSDVFWRFEMLSLWRRLRSRCSFVVVQTVSAYVLSVCRWRICADVDVQAVSWFFWVWEWSCHVSTVCARKLQSRRVLWAICRTTPANNGWSSSGWKRLPRKHWLRKLVLSTDNVMVVLNCQWIFVCKAVWVMWSIRWWGVSFRERKATSTSTRASIDAPAFCGSSWKIWPSCWQVWIHSVVLLFMCWGDAWHCDWQFVAQAHCLANLWETERDVWLLQSKVFLSWGDWCHRWNAYHYQQTPCRSVFGGLFQCPQEDVHNAASGLQN